MAKEIAKAYVQIVPTTKGIAKKLDAELGGEVEKSGKTSGHNFAKGFGTAAGAIGKVALGALTAAAAVVGKIVKDSVSAYADYEQLVGGVETLFGAGGQSLEQYAEAIGTSTLDAMSSYYSLIAAQEAVVKSANEAYKTAGMSANQYMETVTSFSASLIQSLGGDTQKAAQYADKAIIDMSDNANKMGTDMELIQNAYQGFAKQNFTMLDNLKLGYGGTKTEMERLILDAEQLDASFEATRDENGNLTMSYADIVDAIHIVQTEMGITGTTAEEAESTISGSLGMVKASWENLITGLASGEDLDDLIENFVGSVESFASNVEPIVMTALDSVGSLIDGLAPKIVEALPHIVTEIVPKLAESAGDVLTSFVTALSSNTEGLAQAAMDIIMTLGMAILDNLPTIVKCAIELIIELVKALITNLPQILLAIAECFVEIVMVLGEEGANILSGIGEWIANLASQAWEWLLGIVDKVVAWGVEMYEKAKTAISDFVTAIIEKVKALPGEIWNWFVQTAAKVLQWQRDMVSKAKTAMVNFVKGIVDKIKELPQKFKTIAHDMITGLWNGINDKVEWIKEKIKGFGESVLGAIKGFFGINSPSRVFRDEVGKWIPEGMAVGITANASSVEEAIDDIKTDAVTELQIGTYRFDGEINQDGNVLGEIVGLLENLLAKDTDFYLDGDVLVGSTASRMDTALGRLQVSRGRMR